MKAEPAVQRRLLDLAEVDGELDRLAHRRRTLPEHVQLADAEGAVRTAKDKLVGVETVAGDLDRDIRRLERDIEGVLARAQRDNTMLAGSGVGARQATELQHELETLARRQTVLEDEQLEVMEQREAVGVDVEHSRGVLASAEQAVGEIIERRDSALADIDAAVAQDYQPLIDWRGTAIYRLRAAANLVRRLQAETTGATPARLEAL